MLEVTLSQTAAQEISVDAAGWHISHLHINQEGNWFSSEVFLPFSETFLCSAALQGYGMF